jgi:guanyl-specific ribonuclease Sa
MSSPRPAKLNPQVVRLAVFLIVLAVGYVAARNGWLPERAAPRAPTTTETGPLTPEQPPQAVTEPGDVVVPRMTIRNEQGNVVYRGDVELTNTLARIAAGKRMRYSHDGSEFQNRERRLPQRPAGYYREWVHPTPGLSGPGPQRVVTGSDGEIYYTPDHYQTFERLDDNGKK